MKNRILTIFLTFVFFLGFSVMLYPTVSDMWNKSIQSKAVVEYEAKLDSLGREAYEEEFLKAKAFNREIGKLKFPLFEYAEVPGYRDILNISGTGIMGYLTIDKINLELPIYHGTAESVLSFAMGHLEGSSFPIGEAGTHAVLTAHRGLPSAELFSNLDKMAVGDRFTVKVLDRTMVYEVDRIKTVWPSEVEDLYPQKGKDYCTLLTCTPYGINSHRLLVRGKRVPPDVTPAIEIRNDAKILNNLYTVPLLMLPMLPLIILSLYLLLRKKKG